MLSWCAVVTALMVGLAAVLRQRRARRRAEELLRLGQVAKLNSLGELAAGMAHELNQPLTAILANTQAAARLLRDDPPDIETARPAMQRAAEQARRAADVLARLRRSVAQPDRALVLQPTSLEHAARNALYLLEPQFRAQQIQTEIIVARAVSVMADATALEQVIHNVLINAVNALRQSPIANRRLRITISEAAAMGELVVADNGPGIAAEILPRVFEPFFTTRMSESVVGESQDALDSLDSLDSLGLGLSICESLVGTMGGRISAANGTEDTMRGAVFTVSLPLAASDAKASQ